MPAQTENPSRTEQSAGGSQPLNPLQTEELRQWGTRDFSREKNKAEESAKKDELIEQVKNDPSKLAQLTRETIINNPEPAAATPPAQRPAENVARPPIAERPVNERLAETEAPKFNDLAQKVLDLDYERLMIERHGSKEGWLGLKKIIHNTRKFWAGDWGNRFVSPEGRTQMEKASRSISKYKWFLKLAAGGVLFVGANVLTGGGVGVLAGATALGGMGGGYLLRGGVEGLKKLFTGKESQQFDQAYKERFAKINDKVKELEAGAGTPEQKAAQLVDLMNQYDKTQLKDPKNPAKTISLTELKAKFLKGERRWNVVESVAGLVGNVAGAQYIYLKGVEKITQELTNQAIMDHRLGTAEYHGDVAREIDKLKASGLPMDFDKDGVPHIVHQDPDGRTWFEFNNTPHPVLGLKGEWTDWQLLDKYPATNLVTDTHSKIIGKFFEIDANQFNADLLAKAKTLVSHPESLEKMSSTLNVPLETMQKAFDFWSHVIYGTLAGATIAKESAYQGRRGLPKYPEYAAAAVGGSVPLTPSGPPADEAEKGIPEEEYRKKWGLDVEEPVKPQEAVKEDEKSAEEKITEADKKKIENFIDIKKIQKGKQLKFNFSSDKPIHFLDGSKIDLDHAFSIEEIEQNKNRIWISDGKENEGYVKITDLIPYQSEIKVFKAAEAKKPAEKAEAKPEAKAEAKAEAKREQIKIPADSEIKSSIEDLFQKHGDLINDLSDKPLRQRQIMSSVLKDLNTLTAGKNIDEFKKTNKKEYDLIWGKIEPTLNAEFTGLKP